MKSFKQHTTTEGRYMNKQAEVGNTISSMSVRLNRTMGTDGYHLLDSKTQSKIKKLRKDMDNIIKEIDKQ